MITSSRIRTRKRTNNKEGIYWTDIGKQREYLDSFAIKKGILNSNDWYKVSTKDLKKDRGASLLNVYNGSLICALIANFPDVKWDLTRWKTVPKHYWNSLSHQRSFFDNFSRQNNFQRDKDWYSITNKMILQQGGKTILHKYSNSLAKALKNVYPEKEWNNFEFSTVPKNFWNSHENKRNFLDMVASKLNIKTTKDWYNVTLNDIKEFGGRRLLDIHQNSLFIALQSVYPEKNWSVLHSRCYKKRYSKDKVILSDFLLQIQRHFRVEKKTDWYRLSFSQILQLNGAGILQRSLYSSLSFIHPDQEWKKSIFLMKNKKSAQRYLLTSLQQIYSKFLIYEDYDHPSLCFSSNFSVEIDLFLPVMMIGFEYHGEQHFDEIPAMKGNTGFYRDSEKLKLCKDNEIKLITIPYWWDLSVSSLQRIINDYHYL